MRANKAPQTSQQGHYPALKPYSLVVLAAGNSNCSIETLKTGSPTTLTPPVCSKILVQGLKMVTPVPPTQPLTRAEGGFGYQKPKKTENKLAGGGAVVYYGRDTCVSCSTQFRVRTLAGSHIWSLSGLQSSAPWCYITFAGLEHTRRFASLGLPFAGAGMVVLIVVIT